MLAQLGLAVSIVGNLNVWNLFGTPFAFKGIAFPIAVERRQYVQFSTDLAQVES